MSRPLVIGVTGGIGSGKSTVCAMFAEFGIPVIDTDQVAREVVVPGSEGLSAVVAVFGSGILTPQGELDRAALRKLVFQNPALRVQLEQILHPRIRARVAAHIAKVTTPYCLVGIPLLSDRKSQSYLDRVLVVDCPEEVQESRVMQRDGLTREEVVAIMKTQATRAQRRALADEVIVNGGDLHAVRAEVVQLHQRYLALAEQTVDA